MTRILSMVVIVACLVISHDARADVSDDLIDDILMSPISEPCKAVAIFTIGGAAAVAAAGASTGGGLFIIGGLAALSGYYGPDMAQEKCDDFAGIDDTTDSWTSVRTGPFWWNRIRYRVICEEHPENEGEEICRVIVEDASILPSTPQACADIGTCVNTLLSGNYGVSALSVNSLVETINFVDYSGYWDWQRFNDIHNDGSAYQYELQY